MGCEKKFHPDKSETDQSPVLSPRGTECQAERDYPNSVTVYNPLKSASQQCVNSSNFQKNYKMASDNNASDGKNRGQDSVREPVESTDETISEIVETNSKSEDENEVDNVANPEIETARTENNNKEETNIPNRDNGDIDNIRSESTNVMVSDDNNTKLVNATEQMNVEDDDEKQKESERLPVASHPVEVIAQSSSEENTASNGPLSENNIQLEVLNRLERLKDQLDTLTDIPPILFDVSLNCLKPSTIEYMSYHLDVDNDVLSPDDKCKDYRGMAEWIGLENIFIKYISRSSFMLKTREVLSKWLTIEVEPLPTLKNLRDCLLAIDRPDVLEDMSIKMARDAVSWKMTQFEANTKKQSRKEDTSWQLTRHDVVSGKKTMYTACLLYADEDELMAQLITKLYKTAYKDALFFLPQFDLKHGKYELDTTARVIDERCDKKVVFLLSEYFYASHICQFAVNYAANHGTGHGNLIPFHLTRNVNAVPNVLKGIAGIRWFRKGTRQHTWQVLSDSLLAEKLQNVELLADIKERIGKMVEKDKEYYLQDPPYDDDVEPPGEPIEVIEPEGSSSMPSSIDLEFQRLKIEEELQRTKKKSKWKIMRQIGRAIFEKILPFNPHHGKCHSSSPSPNMTETELRTFKVSGTDSKNDNSVNSLTYSMQKERDTDDGSELGAVGGEDISPKCNDLNIDAESPKTYTPKEALNIPDSESMVMKPRTVSLRENNSSLCSQREPENVTKLSNGSSKLDNTNYSDMKGKDKQRNYSRKTTSSYEKKTMNCDGDKAERETLICKESHKETVLDTCDDVKQTDALMAGYNQT
ncbi:uncharacterized protein LOC123559412 [Mercenaria mercenaria]|uniref:uncharacterized protein LOC123559412 n=1 Tax=Mercenaria mercenaria TaxID=6596 RepID=UPI00234E8B09|nr:uncharacterized protein LOC123559412 [Mercenaria mercenaria]XP_045207134.2 uncharacterized protein LOC123559412 [Mercenaria mercenaria]XP_045207136.2 uncharacterized protein LOC123559412 [Mercenaria mercenaria]XP_045207137.2 uncharacterized protein LOC123559412 [Mercenaria mercenaria]XP_045207138.2 uncharacterized protein LOC123559412 [Mercenaria mercenaria]